MWGCAFRRGTFYFSQAVLPLLLDNVKDGQYPPTLIFTSATAASKSILILTD